MGTFLPFPLPTFPLSLCPSPPLLLLYSSNQPPIHPQGTYLGTLEDVNHLDLVGWINTARYKWAEIRG